MSDQYYVGIDLGTTNSCLAYSDNDGNVKTSIGDDGSDIIPSVVLFGDNGMKHIGHSAKEMCGNQNPSDYVNCFKRQMGMNIKRTIRSITYTPTEISAMVIIKLFNDFEKNFNVRPDKAVITVPGDYADYERNATIESARIAGINNVELLNEPVAAALSYGIGRGDKKDKTIIVYDLGGGTFDATVLKIEGGAFTVLSSEGSKNLGGRDWDLQLATIIQKKVLDSTGLTFEDIESDSDFRRILMADAEKQKEALTYQDRVFSKIMLRGKEVTYTVTREELEESTTWLMSRTVEMVGYALRNAKMKMSDINGIILVGGSTMMPQVMRSLEDAYPSTDIEFFDPEHAVARGAAIYAESIFGGNKVNVTSVLSKTFGVLAGIDGVEKICNVLYRNVPLPMENILMCRPKRDDQRMMEISIYESLAKSNEEYIDVADGNRIFKTTIELPGKISRGRTKIAVRFSADRGGRITAVIECNGVFIECKLSEVVMLSNEGLINSRSKMRGIL